MNTWLARKIGTKNVGIRTSGSTSTGSTPGVTAWRVTQVAVATATTRSSAPNAFQAWVRARRGGERGSPPGLLVRARGAVVVFPPVARLAKAGAELPSVRGPGALSSTDM